MSSSQEKPIKDFAEIKNAMAARGLKTSDGHASNRALPVPSHPPDDKSSQSLLEERQPDLSNGGVGLHPDDELGQTRIRIAALEGDLAICQRRAAEMEDDRARGNERIEQLTAELASLQANMGRMVDRFGAEKADLEKREQALVIRQLELEADRALFVEEFDQLDSVKGREQECSSREAEISSKSDAIAQREELLAAAELKLEQDLKSQDERQSAQEQCRSDLRVARGQLTKATNKLDALTSDFTSLQQERDRLLEDRRALRRDGRALKRDFAACVDANNQLTQALGVCESQLSRLRAERGRYKLMINSIPDLTVNSEAILNWLAQDGLPEHIGLDDQAMLGWSGTGSYDPEVFDTLLKNLGFDQRNIPHHSISHVVVGRDAWSKDDLMAQIEARQGQTLRVYSQEMLLAALITGRDPLDCEDRQVLDDFKNGHPALEFLAQSEFEWPSIATVDTAEIEDVGDESFGVNESPLHLLGYKVGEQRLLTPVERHDKLLEAFESPDLPWVDSDEYMSKWGAPRSHQRLWRIAYHLAVVLLGGPAGKDYRKPQARKDWLEDLEWLHENLYVPKRYRFSWPDVEVV